ncbi:hypothetical protein IC229_31235 [Spirosoma sp. BT702]|uniref:Uncharacterized protein n=1 Tax=Spirosoma profusum TaxID=2771354 RepID=A0A927AVE2_9BACT|nr:hypothetical protein [Spirosoma profusum]MBD2705138.1 hypothetical protein [Spirosoma profusum]
MEGQQKGGKDTALELKLKKILINWSVAATDFFHQYNQISLYLDSIHHTPRHEMNWIGQYHVPQLISLQATMRNELERLLLDIDQIDQQSIANRYEQLANHTRILRQLNQQANMLLELALLPAN